MMFGLIKSLDINKCVVSLAEFINTKGGFLFVKNP